MKHLKRINESQLEEFGGGGAEHTAIGGFTLVAWKLPDGGYQLGSTKGDGRIIDSFPKEIECFGSVYGLENVEEFANGFVNAEYC